MDMPCSWLILPVGHAGNQFMVDWHIVRALWIPSTVHEESIFRLHREECALRYLQSVG